MFTFPLLAQLAWTGLAISSAYCLFAVAFALVLKVNQVWNFAQAAMMVVAYYALYFAYRIVALPVWAGLALALAATMASAWAIERGFASLRRRNSAPLTYFIFTIMASQLAVFLAELLFGSDPKTLFPSLMSPVSLVGPVAVSNWDILAMATTVLLLLGLWLFIRYSRAGRRMVAVADNPDVAELFGISASRNYLGAMMIASLLVVAGIYLAGSKLPMVPSSPLNQFLVFAIIASLLAGIGNIFQAAIAAIALSLLQAFSILFIPSRWQIMIVYGLIIVCIMLFPKGVRLPALRLPRRAPVATVAEAGAGRSVS